MQPPGRSQGESRRAQRDAPLMSDLSMPAGATAPGRWRVLQWLWHELRVGLPISLMAAVFISTMFRDPFGRTLIYSLCIGLSIQFLIEGGRYLGTAWRRRRDPASVRHGSLWPGWAWMGPWSVGAAVIGYFGGSLLADLLTGQHHTRDPLGADLRPLSLILMLSLGFTVSAVYFFYSRGRLAALQAAAEAAQRSAAEAQLKLLQSQLEPHMLFNTLANLRVLIGADPVRAQTMLDRLIAFLRATLSGVAQRLARAGRRSSRACDDYLALMAVRMGAAAGSIAVELPDALRDAAGAARCCCSRWSKTRSGTGWSRR